MRKLSIASSSGFAAGSIQLSGGVKALDIAATPNYSTEGFFSVSSQVAYRVVWGIKDSNENLILGVPSNRTVVENISTTQTCITSLSFAIPSDITSTSYFYQIYRTGVFPNDPGDEMYLVFEDFVTSGQITAGLVTTTDITPEDFRKGGTLLYTNPQSGEGISQSNEKPPFCQDITSYKGYTFFGNTSTVHRLNLSAISIQDMISETSTITVTDGITSKTYKFRGNIETYTADFSNGALVAGDFYNPGGTAKYFVIDAANDERKYYVWYFRTNETDPAISGRIGIKVDVSAGVPTVTDIRNSTDSAILLATDDFNTIRVAAPLGLTIKTSNNGYVTASTFTDTIANFIITSDGLGTGEDSSLSPPRVFLPRVPTGTENGPSTAQQVEQMSQSLIRIINKVDTLVYGFYLSSNTDVPGKMLFEQRSTTGNAFYFTANSTTTGDEFTPSLPTSGNSVISSNEVKPNRIYYSKYQQPEAVPLSNYIDIGPKDKHINRIIGLRDSLFIFKDDGIYKLSGDTAPFQLAPFDFSVNIKAADTAAVLNNQIYALSTQGVITVTDTGVNIISRPIEDLLLDVTRDGFNFKYSSFGVGYESDRAYHLWTVTESTDTVATQCFRFNTFTNSWVRWNKSATCGLINFSDDKMYLGAGDKNWIDKERKSLTRTDHADREGTLTVLQNGVNESIININSVTDIAIGDRVIQTQYLTISKFNRLLQKLDIDPSVNDTNYYSTLFASPGDNLRSKIVALAAKLDSDLGVSDTDYSSKIGDYTQTITSTTPGSSTIVTFGSNSILSTRYVTISGSNTTPSIDGTHLVTNYTGTTITIGKTTTIAGSAGSVQTDTQNFKDIQACYNIIINKLNSDSGVFYTNYELSTGTIEFESVITDRNTSDIQITLLYPVQLIEGPITYFKQIQTKLVWNPQTFGDVSMFKQVREGTVIFENNNYTFMDVGYATDLSPSFEEVTIQGKGDGDFGYFPFGEINFGGVAAAIPIRLYIPRQKQRCRYMHVRVEHNVALETFGLYGMSLTFRPYSVRAYK